MDDDHSSVGDNHITVGDNHITKVMFMVLSTAFVAKGHLDELQEAEIVNTSKLVHAVIIKTHYWINHR